jgi:hypothetical protein
MIGAPEDVVIDNNEVSGNGVAFIEDILVNAFDVVYGDGERIDAANKAH